MSSTPLFIARLSQLKPGELGLLRTHAAQRLDESIEGFDLFTGLWWPLRQQRADAPRREVAWLIAKLYAAVPLPHQAGKTLARQLARCQPSDAKARARYQQRFDRLLQLPLSDIEPALRWALGHIAAIHPGLDWVQLTDDLSSSERDAIRHRWAVHYLEP